MKKTYQIYASSIEGAGSDIAEQEFNFDWGIIPEGEYEMSWSLMSSANKISADLSQIESVPTKIEINVPFMTDRYEVTAVGVNAGYAVSSTVAGFIHFYDGPLHTGHVMRQYKAVYSDNAPVIVRGKPSGNKFIVRCVNELTLGTMQEYTLAITFKSLC